MRCVPSEMDRRYKKITCTEQSSEMYKMILAHDEAVFLELCSDMTEDQRKEFVRLADLVLKHIDSR